jgi:predicted RNase H-like HicB family nuclease
MVLTYNASYTVIDGGYMGEVLDFPGAVSQGDTLNDVRSNLASALHDLVESYLLDGMALPLPKADYPLDGTVRGDREEAIYVTFQTGNDLSHVVTRPS